MALGRKASDSVGERKYAIYCKMPTIQHFRIVYLLGIPELLAELEFPFEDGSIKVPKVDKIEGDAVINVRKGKRILVFELNISASWEGKVG